MKPFALLRLILACAALVCAALRAAGAEPAGKREIPPLILISLDAFRWDYCALHPEQTPHLRELMRTGISARSLIPAYPSNTFANHYSIITGLYPSHHGIINNNFFDPTTGRFFNSHARAAVQEGRWWGGEPLWVTAGKAGLATATSFWVGSEAEIKGLRPTYWKSYDDQAAFADRLAEFTRWLELPAGERPAFIAFYLVDANTIGHHAGPESPELVRTLGEIDAHLGEMFAQVKAAGLAANFVVVSDHGMTPISPERVILLDDYIDPASVQLDFDGPAAGLRPLNGDADALVRALAPLQHAKAYRVDALPKRFHITDNPRNPPVWIVPEEGWEIYFRARFEKFQNRFNKGDHGYDPAFVSMHGILIANGPSFRSDGAVVDSVENVHIYNLLCAALQLTPAPNDGDDRLVRAMLQR
jgi:predicted AlkP superfamily pyrophosphatase or phosphodiesterase